MKGIDGNNFNNIMRLPDRGFIDKTLCFGGGRNGQDMLF